MLNLNSTVNFDFKSFLRWWRRELILWIPEKIRYFITDKQGFIIVTPEAGQLKLTYVNNNQSILLTILDRFEGAVAQYQALLEQDEKLTKAAVILRLTRADALVRELLLPIAARENLQQVIAYELDRYTPFKAEQVYFAAQLLEGVHEPGQIRVRLILTTRELLDSLIEDVKLLGMAPILVDYEDIADSLEDYRSGYNLLPEKDRPKTARTPTLIYSGLISLASILLIATLALPVWFKYQTLQVLTENVQSIEKDAKKVKMQQKEVDAVIKETQELINEKIAMPEVIDILNTLSTIIKDDTFLAYMQYSEGHIQIQGESPAASGLIAVLEDSDLFNNARFVSPVTQDNISKLERFQITVDATQKGGGHEKSK